MRVRELADHTEQLRIAKAIHDGYGHAITELYTVCQMCLELKDSDPEKCRLLLLEGTEICRRASAEGFKTSFESISELLSYYAGKSTFPSEITIEGSEPEIIKDKYEVIGAACKEAFHNTLSHSMADKFLITLRMEGQHVTLILSDNGSFRGSFEKGFGLTNLENSVIYSGGTVRFSAEEGKGFTVIIEWRQGE